jgi:hypothetical protein
LSDATWTWDGSNWTQQTPATSPPPREAAAMAYDPATGNIVMFGGQVRNGVSGDTWTWDGSNWTRQTPTTSPSARSGAAMAYDNATGDDSPIRPRLHSHGLRRGRWQRRLVRRPRPTQLLQRHLDLG